MNGEFPCLGTNIYMHFVCCDFVICGGTCKNLDKNSLYGTLDRRPPEVVARFKKVEYRLEEQVQELMKNVETVGSK